MQMEDFLKTWVWSKEDRGTKMTPGFLAVGSEWLVGSLLRWGKWGMEVVGERKSRTVFGQVEFELPPVHPHGGEK